MEKQYDEWTTIVHLRAKGAIRATISNTNNDSTNYQLAFRLGIMTAIAGEAIAEIERLRPELKKGKD